MKLYNVITGHNYCIIDTNYVRLTCDISREEEEYQRITFSRVLTLSDLKKMQEELDIYAYEFIQQNDEYYENIETIYEYEAVTEDGEEVRIFVPDMW